MCTRPNRANTGSDDKGPIDFPTVAARTWWSQSQQKGRLTRMKTRLVKSLLSFTAVAAPCKYDVPDMSRSLRGLASAVPAGRG